MKNSADPHQMASSEATDLDLHSLQSQGIYVFSRARVKTVSDIRGFNNRPQKVLYPNQNV